MAAYGTGILTRPPIVPSQQLLQQRVHSSALCSSNLLSPPLNTVSPYCTLPSPLPPWRKEATSSKEVLLPYWSQLRRKRVIPWSVPGYPGRCSMAKFTSRILPRLTGSLPTHWTLSLSTWCVALMGKPCFWCLIWVCIDAHLLSCCEHDWDISLSLSLVHWLGHHLPPHVSDILTIKSCFKFIISFHFTFYLAVVCGCFEIEYLPYWLLCVMWNVCGLFHNAQPRKWAVVLRHLKAFLHFSPSETAYMYEILWRNLNLPPPLWVH